MLRLTASGRSSPTQSTSNIFPNQELTESPTSTNHSTPALRPEAVHNDDGNESVPELQLDDIQSTVPLHDIPEDNEVSTTISFPQDSSLHKVPSVTITTSTDHLLAPSTPIITTPPNTTGMTIPVLSPHTNQPDLSPSTASSALTEGDKLTELPISFSAPRLQSLARKASEAAGTPIQDSGSSSIKGNPGRRSIDSEHSGRGRGDSTPIRVSFEGDRPSFSSSVINAVGVLPTSPQLDGKTGDARSPQKKKSHSSPGRSPSPRHNFFWPLHRSHSREEPFVIIDPYKLNIFPVSNTLRHILSQVLRQIYRHMLLRLPSIYFSRVSRVFESAEVSRPEVQRMIEERNKGDIYRWPADHEWVAPKVSPALIRFKESWESFVESVLKEWKTLNVVSALLLTCVVLLPIYDRSKPEIEGASTAPVIRTTAFLSLICALMSLVYGCMYILRFGTMKSMYRASKWAEEAQQATSIFWNVWILLAMPAVWISWSMIFFCVCILDFVWDQPFSSPSSLRDFSRRGDTPSVLTVSLSDANRVALAPRIIISVVFVLGLIYLFLVVRTFRSWGDPRVSQLVRDGMEGGRWTPRTPSPAPGSPRLGREPRSNVRKAVEMVDEEKSAVKKMKNERRTRSVDSLMV